MANSPDSRHRNAFSRRCWAVEIRLYSARWYPLREHQTHPWRSLKTASSARVIPLVGSSKWAAGRILAHPDSSEFAFPNYNDGERTNANSASAALNKWLKTKIGREYTIHSFRHSMRDRLRRWSVQAMLLIRLVAGSLKVSVTVMAVVFQWLLFKNG